MAAGNCGVCESRVASGVACERCNMWYHMSCAGFTGNTKALENSNVLYLCDACLSLTKAMWKGAAEVEVLTQGTQTEEPVLEERSVQTETAEVEVEALGTQTEDPVLEEKSVQTERTDPKPMKRGPPTTQMRKVKPPIRVIGDSMVKEVNKEVRLRVKDSSCTSLRGAWMPKITGEVVQEAASMKDGDMLIVQGGGNGLEQTGEEATVQGMVEAVKAVEGKGVDVAVIGVLRRPAESRQYEWMRRRTNRRLQEELMTLKMKWMKEKKGNISFLDLDAALQDDRLFAADGVHLSDAGRSRLGRRLREWVAARSLRPIVVNVSDE